MRSYGCGVVEVDYEGSGAFVVSNLEGVHATKKVADVFKTAKVLKEADGFLVSGTKKEVFDMLSWMKESYGEMTVSDFLNITRRALYVPIVINGK
jgi:hypothetical protein